MSSVLTEHGQKSDGVSEVHSVSVSKGVINQVEHLGRSFAASDRSNYNLAKPGDVIYTKSPTGEFPYGIIKLNKLPNKAIVSPLYGVFEPKNEYLGYILDCYFESPFRANSYLEPITKKGAKNTIQISNSTFLSGGLYLPRKKAEQRKIADCLGALDELIAAASQKLTVLKARKKGLMQQLFPREGESVPRLRFPEFARDQDWAKTIAGDLFAQRKEGGEEGLPIYSVTINDGMVPRSSFDRDFYDIQDPAGNRKVSRGDIAYNMMRMWQGAHGVASVDCMVSPAYVVLKPKGRVCVDFFFYLFKLPQTLQLLTATSRGLTQDRLRLYFDDFARMRLCIPGYDEQRRIAATLSSVDQLIAVQGERLTALKEHKQGLMQQLFAARVESEA